MNGNVFASSFSASTIVLNSNAALTHNAYYAVVCDAGCTTVTMPSLTISPTGSLVNNSRMFLLKNVSAATVTVNAAGGDSFEGGASSLTLTPNQWAVVHGDNTLARWNVYRPDSPGSQVTDVTYAQLMAFVGATAATGTTSGFYRITDYATAGYIIGSSGATYQGTTEPLLVNVYFNTAMGSTAQVSREAFSPMYPDDVIYYDPFPSNWIYDKSFCLNYDASSMVTHFKGVIFYRHDLKANIKGGYDWRNCIMRKWNFSAGTAAAYGATTSYAIGDSMQYLDGSFYIKVSGGPTGFRSNDWVQSPINTSMFVVPPENNENLTAPTTVSWDLCVNDYAHGATGATFRFTATTSTTSDQLTFDTAAPPYTKNIDLGRYNFQLGETLLPQPSGAGPTAGSYARRYGTIVNQVRMSNGSLGSESTAFNRFNNVTLGGRAWGVHFASAGDYKLTGNDQQNIHITDQCQNVTFNPYPDYNAADDNREPGATSLNIAPGFKNISVRKAVNCYFGGGMADCDLGAVRDTLFQWCSALRVGNNQNYEGSAIEYSGVLPTPPFSFSTGNVLTHLSDVAMGQVRYSLVTGASHSTFRNVERAHIVGGEIDGLQVNGELRNTTLVSIDSVASLVRSVVFNGRVRSNYFKDVQITNSAFDGDVERNFLDTSIFDANAFRGVFSDNILDGCNFTGNVFSAQASHMFATAGAVSFCNFGYVDGAWFDSNLLQTSSVSGIFGFTGALADTNILGILRDTEGTFSGCTIMGGMTGVTGIELVHAVVYPGTLSGLGDMSAAVHPAQRYSKIYMQSESETPYGVRLVDSGGPVVAWDFFGATA